MLFKVVGIGLLGVIINILLKQYKPEFAVLSNVCCGIVLLFIVFENSQSLFGGLLGDEMFSKVQGAVIKPILKVIGIGYLTEFSSDLAEDSGNKSIANKIILGGKIAICIIALPILKELISAIISIV